MSPSKRVAVLGSTGSVGRSALDLIKRLNGMPGSPGASWRAEEGAAFQVAALAAHRNVALLADQIREFRPLVACIVAEDLAGELRRAVSDVPTRILSGASGLKEIAVLPEADLVLAGIVGAAGLESTHAAVVAGKVVALANKETLVMAGGPIMAAARASGAEILPVDSEHNALHQCLRGEKVQEVRRLVLTASGGPFFGNPSKDLSRVTPAEALAHPTWKMGRKISVDSATLMNKGLEIIEARWLFGVEGDRISVVVHPQSVVHSMVEFVDGSLICQLGATDMRAPIQYALTYPDRCATPLEPLDLARLPRLEFYEPDLDRFPCLGLGWAALARGGTMPAVLNAANEVAVEAFLDERIKFSDIPVVIAGVMEAHRSSEASSIGEILHADAWARGIAAEATASLAIPGMPNRSGGAS
ncbi:MAG TPA: 1-deoxy-D-xylulose-5-phosphate reductoisomerase [Candidatus Polarisedimenticolia bacterium]|nr:1-deoxy-D-xylulose-5-phosphate reductoisomerase [Candidatus Polarisedimenticolia bacterium]